MNIAVCGLGKTGLEVARLLKEQREHNLTAGFCSSGSQKAGRDIGALAQIAPWGVKTYELAEAESVLIKNRVDVVIDFSCPQATLELLKACHKTGVGAVVCTTGFSEEQIESMHALAAKRRFGLVFAPNVTIGINIMMNLVNRLAQCLPEYDYLITEMHHNKKNDIPSGTAKKIAKVLKSAFGEKKKKPTPIHSVRAGGYIGHHDVLAVGENEKIMIVHESFSRKAFAEGALCAARFIRGKRGWYEMKDVIS